MDLLCSDKTSKEYHNVKNLNTTNIEHLGLVYKYLGFRTLLKKSKV